MANSNKEKLKLEGDVIRAVELLQKLQNAPYGTSSFSKGSVNSEKLHDLEQVLSSELFNSVREVYEKVYNTVDINGNSDLKSTAAAKATISIMTGTENHSHPRKIRLPKTDEGYGFNIVGGQEQVSPIYISRIIPGGLAERMGELRRGDQLIEIDGINVENETHNRVVELLKNAKNEVNLTVRYMPDYLDRLEIKFNRPQIRKSRKSSR